MSETAQLHNFFSSPSLSITILLPLWSRSLGGLFVCFYFGGLNCLFKIKYSCKFLTFSDGEIWLFIYCRMVLFLVQKYLEYLEIKEKKNLKNPIKQKPNHQNPRNHGWRPISCQPIFLFVYVYIFILVPSLNSKQTRFFLKFPAEIVMQWRHG